MRLAKLLAVELLAAVVLVVPAYAECLSADQLGNPGPYYGGLYSLPSGMGLTASMGPFKSPVSGSIGMGQPELLPAPGQCQGATTLLLKTSNSNFLFLTQHAVGRITIDYCDGADQNNLSVRPLAFDYVGDVVAANGQQLPGLNGMVDVRVTPNGGGMHSGTVELTGNLQYVAFGGAETFIAQVCVE
ncbi:MAG: hypothetical protein HY834_15200 [Devosia nanyangense]|uniref:DUF4402 domain-containing protein n=1 Tax=Devosia nanyangense TaxID=1228055 RepID=A0A933NXM4_9HYPH|nr:hypothetical protein [Devosia nanyangense]